MSSRWVTDSIIGRCRWAGIGHRARLLQTTNSVQRKGTPGTGRLKRDRIGELRTRGLDHAVELAQNDLPLGVAHRRDEVGVGR